MARGIYAERAAALTQITVQPKYPSRNTTPQIMPEVNTALLSCLPMMLEKKKVYYFRFLHSFYQ